MTGGQLFLQRILAGLRRLDEAVAGEEARVRAPLSGDPVGPLGRLLRRLRFGAQVRAQVWQLVADMVDAGVSLDETVAALAQGFRSAGRKGRALVFAELSAGIQDGNAGARLAPYVSSPERLILEGLGGQDAGKVFGSAARLLRNRLAVRKAMSGAMAMPLLLVSGLLGMVVFFGLQLLPALSQVIDLDEIKGWQGLMVKGVLAFSANPLRLAFILGGLVAGTVLAMRFWTGPGRIAADRFPPFSLMRLQAGTGFLFAVIEHGRHGTGVTPDLLEDMAKASGRYEASRIRAMIAPFERTSNLGSAALEAGQGFPNDEMALVMECLWNSAGGIDRAGDFLERRLAQVESDVKARTAVLNVVLLVGCTAAFLALISVALPIVDLIEKSMGSL